MIKALSFICLLLLGILPLAAQNTSGGNKGRSAWFACTSIPGDLENPVKVLEGKNITEVELLKYMTSEPVKIPEDGIVRIVREVPDPENPEEVKYLVLAAAKVPATVRNALIILVPMPELEGDLVFQAKVQDLADFKGGDRFYINMSDTHVRVKLGDTIVGVPAKDSKIYQSPKLSKPLNMPIMYEFFHPGQKKWRMLTASTVVLRPTRRKICIFNDGTRIGNIKKHSILFPINAEVSQ